jgi:hypothetical protein
MKKLFLSVIACATLTAHAQLSNSVPAAGPVGIGTVTPYAGAQLTVNGVARILNALTADGILTANSSAILHSYVRMSGIASYGGDFSDVEILVRSADGNITRETLFDVAIALGTPPSDFSYCSPDSITAPRWFHGINKLFSPCPQVKVGVGTNTPTHNLDVKGTTFTVRLKVGNELGSDTAMINAYAFNHTQPLLQLGKKIGALPTELRFVVNNDGSIAITNVGSNPAITINNGSGHAIVIKDSAGVKLAQLENTGLFRSRSVRVDLATWADFVFEKGYKLMSLKDTKLFIKKHGHLPNVPKATTIEKEGLDLGEMQRIQMQKIEELTLHLIEMDERLTKMQNRVNALEKENKELKGTNN